MRILFAAAVAGLSGLSSTALADNVKLDLSNEYSATSLVGLADQDFIDRVARETGGTVVITPHFGGALGFKSKDHFDAVRDGAVPIAGTYTGVFTGIDPVFALSSMPFQTPTIEDARAMYEAARPAYEKVFADNNQKLLYASPYTPTGVWSRKALDNIGAFKDLKVRTYDAAGVDVFSRIGAAPIQLSWADTIPQLATGGIDAILTSDETGIAGTLWEHLGYFNVVPYSVAINMTHMNLDIFNDLSPDQQAAIEKAAKETEEAAWARAKARMKSNSKILEEKGVKVVAPSDELIEQLQAAGDATLKRWLDDMAGRGEKILASYRDIRAAE